MDHVSFDEPAAVAGAAGGDGAAFGVLVERHQEAAFRAAYLILRDAQAAEDVAQEGFIRAYRGMRKFRQGEPFRPWLLRIVTNLALNEARARTRRSGLLGRLGPLTRTTDDPPDDAAAAADEAAAVARAINELPEADRVVLYLRYFLELSEREIATAIGRPAGTVKSRLHRAGQRLREVIERKYPQLKEAIGG
ncbi:MAG: RNA polymerase sigma factor [Dehalococcoidia bacterium]